MSEFRASRGVGWVVIWLALVWLQLFVTNIHLSRIVARCTP